MVCEFGGRRIQWFDSEGKSKHIFNIANNIILWVETDSKNQVLLYDRKAVFESRKLISILNEAGKEIKKIGKYHDNSDSPLGAEGLCFAVDDRDNIYAANLDTPLIRKYSPDDELLLVITFKPPFKIPKVKITLNSRKTAIKRKDSEDNQAVVEVKRTKNKAIMVTSSKSERIFHGIDVDSQQRIYIVTPKRLITRKEFYAKSGYVHDDGVYRADMDFDITRNININRLLVFSPGGKVIAEAELTGFCNRIRISGDRIFIIDGIVNQRILEYRVRFEE